MLRAVRELKQGEKNARHGLSTVPGASVQDAKGLTPPPPPRSLAWQRMGA